MSLETRPYILVIQENRKRIKDTSSRSSLREKSHREEKRSEVRCNGQ